VPRLLPQVRQPKAGRHEGRRGHGQGSCEPLQSTCHRRLTRTAVCLSSVDRGGCRVSDRTSVAAVPRSLPPCRPGAPPAAACAAGGAGERGLAGRGRRACGPASSAATRRMQSACATQMRDQGVSAASASSSMNLRERARCAVTPCNAPVLGPVCRAACPGIASRTLRALTVLMRPGPPWAAADQRAGALRRAGTRARRHVRVEAAHR
jgi:hypothetical protein